MLHQRAPELSRQRGPSHLSLPPRILIGVLFRVPLDGLALARPEGCGQRRRRHLPFFGNRENPFLRVLPRPVCERSRLRTDGKGLRTCCQPGLKRFEMLLPMVTSRNGDTPFKHMFPSCHSFLPSVLHGKPAFPFCSHPRGRPYIFLADRIKSLLFRHQ
jgi:hypothetical protein